MVNKKGPDFSGPFYDYTTIRTSDNLEREKGFEPSTFSLARRRSTPEPLPLYPPARGILYTIYIRL